MIIFQWRFCVKLGPDAVGCGQAIIKFRQVVKHHRTVVDETLCTSPILLEDHDHPMQSSAPFWESHQVLKATQITANWKDERVRARQAKERLQLDPQMLFCTNVFRRE
jgi:hypothetical protein